MNIQLHDWQKSFLDRWDNEQGNSALVFAGVGKGKTLTALLMLEHRGIKQATIIAPKSTKDSWLDTPKRFGIDIDLEVITHAKFRMDNWKPTKGYEAVVFDEIHMLGSNTSKGSKKAMYYARKCATRNIPIIGMSATPNYNDGERWYTVMRSLWPDIVKGGYDNWLAKHCVTKYNPFSPVPDFIGFRKGLDRFLKEELPFAYVCPEEDIEPIEVKVKIDERHKKNYDLLERFSVIPPSMTLVSSVMEKTICKHYLELFENIDVAYPSGEKQPYRLRPEIREAVRNIMDKDKDASWIFYFNKTKTAEAFMRVYPIEQDAYVYYHGKLNDAQRKEIIQAFVSGEKKVMVCTDAIATGTDGLQEVCHNMIIIDDTTDNCMRQQLIGRIHNRLRKDGTRIPANIYRLKVML